MNKIEVVLVPPPGLGRIWFTYISPVSARDGVYAIAVPDEDFARFQTEPLQKAFPGRWLQANELFKPDAFSWVNDALLATALTVADIDHVAPCNLWTTRTGQRVIVFYPESERRQWSMAAALAWGQEWTDEQLRESWSRCEAILHHLNET